MLRQAHPPAHLFFIRFQEKLHNLSFFIMPFFTRFRFLRLLSFGFQPALTWFYQLIFGKVDLFPFAFSLVTLIAVRAMFTRIFIGIADISVFLYALLSQDFPSRTVYQVSLRISDKITFFCFFQLFLRTSIYTALIPKFIHHLTTDSLNLQIL